MILLFTTIGPIATIFILSFLVSLIITLIYKFATNQGQMKQIKESINNLRKEMKETKEPKKMGEINGMMMEKTMEQFRASMKPMLITMIPALLILGWMQTNIAYEQISPGNTFTTSANFETGATGEIELNAPGLEINSDEKQNVNTTVQWSLRAQNEGDYELTYVYGNEVYTRNIKISNNWDYSDPLLEKQSSFLGLKTGDEYPIRQDSKIRSITVDLKKIQPFGSFNIFGWHPGWLGSYILMSLGFSMLLRAVLKVH